MAEQDKPLTPPYIAFGTFKNMLKQLGTNGLSPTLRIDGSVLGTMGGSARLQFLGALRYLNLIDEHKHPTPAMERLATATDQEWPALLSAILKEHYQQQIKHLAHGSPQQLRESFGTDFPSITTPAVRFLVAAAKDVGMQVNEHHKTVKGRSNSPRPRQRRNRQDSNGEQQREQPSNPVNASNAAPPSVEMALLAKFPEFDANWKPEQQAAWFKAYEKLIDVTTKKPSDLK
jgi:hypothetical protein